MKQFNIVCIGACLLLASMLLLAQQCSAEAPDGCQCRCCLTSGCTTAYVGNVNTDNTCLEPCNNDLCRAAFPNACPAQGTGSVTAACASTYNTFKPPATSPAVWAGKYQVNSTGCDTTSCCCPTGVLTIGEDSGMLQARVGQKGICGSEVWMPSIAWLNQTVTRWDLSFTVIKSGGELSSFNSNYPKCAWTAKCSEGLCGAAGAIQVSLAGLFAVLICSVMLML